MKIFYKDKVWELTAPMKRFLLCIVGAKLFFSLSFGAVVATGMHFEKPHEVEWLPMWIQASSLIGLGLIAFGIIMTVCVTLGIKATDHWDEYKRDQREKRDAEKAQAAQD